MGSNVSDTRIRVATTYYPRQDNIFPAVLLLRSCGGIGIHNRLKICRPYGLASSSLAGSIGYLISMEAIMETCVICSVETDVPIDKHIDLRYHYVEGAGQLCKSCWEKIYKK